MSIHKPVLLDEVLNLLDLKEGETVVDCTLGGGGHSKRISKYIGQKGKIIALDFDLENIFLENKYESGFVAVYSNFKDIDKVLKRLNIEKVDKIIADLGFSSDQLVNVAGLSFMRKELLDMRLDKRLKITAKEILNNYAEKEIIKILQVYGEERKAEQIGKAIIEYRKNKEIEDTFQLREIVKECYGGQKKISGIDVATKTFMALRIAVNQELDSLKIFLEKAIKKLKKEGRVAIISFHGLEDKIVKHFFKREAKDCICDEETLRCSCNHKKILKIITKKPILPTNQEIKDNPRSRSAKLRIAKKI
jgi:16S rRNA (cytosine1402-N4)-methyltransferase